MMGTPSSLVGKPTEIHPHGDGLVGKPKRHRISKDIMKRLGNLWPKVFEEKTAVKAVVEGTRQKRGDRQVKPLLYSADVVADDPSKWHMIDPAKAKEYTAPLLEALKNKTWRHKPPRYKRQFCRIHSSTGGKWRDLYIPALDDHIIAHMLMIASMQAFTRGMHPHCCGSVPGRGIKHIVKMCNHWFRHDTECRFFVKLDIRHFFDSVDADILLDILQTKIKDADMLWGHEQIIRSAPVACPVGYYTSPWYANLYLEKLDWFIEQQLYKVRRGKRIKYVKHFLRYADDILLMGTSKSDLEKAIRAIERFVKNLGLEIKPTWEIKRIGRHVITPDGKWKMLPGTYWCDIGGYKFSRDCTIMRDGIYLSARRLARAMYKQGYYTPHMCRSLQARLGWATHSDSNNFLINEIRPYVNVNAMRRRIGDVDKERKRE